MKKQQQHQKPIQQVVSQQQQDNTISKIKIINKVFAISVMVYQLAICLLYGFFIVLPMNANNSVPLISYIITVLQFMLIIVAFGLLFNKTSKRLSFSGLGFTLLITCLCVQSYFLWNAFWSKVQIQPNSINTFLTKDTYDIYLNVYQDSFLGKTSLGANMNEALKCALSMVVAFSFFIGRVGPFQILILSLFGTISYQLSRQINMGANTLDIGSMKIFLFGGAMGLGISMVLKAVEGDVTKNHPNRQVTKNTGTSTLLGLVLAFTLFPLLALDSRKNNFTQYTGPLSVVYSMAAAGLTSFVISFWSLGQDMLILGTLSGGVAILSSSVYITNPVYAIMIGNISALITFFLIKLDRFVQQKFGVLDSFGSFVFLIHGFLGCCWATMNQYIVWGNANGFDYYSNDVGFFSKPGIKNFANGWISIFIGLSTGFLIGYIFISFNFYQGDDYFTDRTCWDERVGMSFEDGDRHIPFHKVNKPVQQNKKPRINQKLDLKNQKSKDPGSRVQLVFFSGDGNIKSNHAYL